MKKRFPILEKPLPCLPRNETASIADEVSALIKKGARLTNDLEKESEKAEKWKKELFLELLEVVDGLERTLQQAEPLAQQDTMEKWIGHVRTTTHQLSWLLKRRGV